MCTHVACIVWFLGNKNFIVTFVNRLASLATGSTEFTSASFAPRPTLGESKDDSNQDFGRFEMDGVAAPWNDDDVARLLGRGLSRRRGVTHFGRERCKFRILFADDERELASKSIEREPSVDLTTGRRGGDARGERARVGAGSASSG